MVVVRREIIIPNARCWSSQSLKDVLPPISLSPPGNQHRFALRTSQSRKIERLYIRPHFCGIELTRWVIHYKCFVVQEYKYRVALRVERRFVTVEQ